MNGSLLLEPCCALCAHSPGQPCPDLVACITEGPICHSDESCRSVRGSRLEQVRRGGEGSVLFVGAGTCGRANGAMRIMERARAFLAERSLPVTIVEVGCVGYCQREVFADLQPADGPRLSYCDLSPENVGEFLDEVFVKGELKNRFLYGRYPAAARQRAAGRRRWRPRGGRRRRGGGVRGARRPRGCPTGRRYPVLRPADPGGAGQLRDDRPSLPGRGAGSRRLRRRGPRAHHHDAQRSVRHGDRLRASRPGRGRLPDGAEVEDRPRRTGRPEVPHLQRRRGRPGRVHGSRRARGRPLPGDRGHADRGVRDRRLQGLRLLPRGVSPCHPAPAGRHQPVPQGRPARAPTSSAA